MLADFVEDDGSGVFKGDAPLAVFLVTTLNAVTFKGDTLTRYFLVGLVFFCTPAFHTVEVVLPFVSAIRPSALRFRSVTMMRCGWKEDVWIRSDVKPAPHCHDVLLLPGS